METIILVIHMLIGVALVGVVLMQKSEGGLGGLGGGGGGGGGGASGGMGGLLGNRQTANLLTRSTGMLAAAFMVTSIGLAILANGGGSTGSIVNEAAPAHGETMTPVPAQPAVPTTPTVPTTE
ncbi:MAG: preprotein translocase subunit SecG [Rhodospirillaceae bacterium]|jgi:preprotein translocase subunit SecG|nr:preprotein translocase subunit SecG [Rhodospirillaceae bacterium]MBT3930358.1 preprotein translocase subunit SecG [Rhodospirillaceae bacterium]MBT4771341.1 preprotein translocase subunit SecG [Rhodospirillaceae bacterium]MBT5359149.1 preprotein translocase subunit SecG [Rhodospirillaceae bacterium]MBT5769019.1 preprotein translocase subunit SecG [Rhodospirillaceae bacterium]